MDVLSDPAHAAELAREHHWEGVFELNADDDRFSFNIIARLIFQGGLIEGAGNASLVGGATLAAPAFTLSGERAGDHIAFRFWFDEDLMGHPFECSGVLDAQERVMDGNWAYHCVDPEGCGCSGGWGPFRLERVLD
jgi:hypothetical protein